MNAKLFTPRFTVVISLVFAGALMRLLPHWPNFTPVAAIALFGGAYIGRKSLAFILPLAAMLLSDLFLGFHPYMIAVYGSFVITVFLGFALRKNRGVFRILGASLLSSVLFFLITNFFMWTGNPNFTQDFAGLMQCYTIAIPFFNNGILGDLFFNGVLFGGFALAARHMPALQRIS